MQSSLVKAECTISGFMSGSPKIWQRWERQLPSLLTYAGQRIIIIFLMKNMPCVLHLLKKWVEISWAMCSFCSESKENNSHCDCIWSFSNVHVKYKTEFLSSPHAYLPSSQKLSTLVLTWGQQPKILGMSPWLFWETILVPEITIVGHGSCREFTWLFLLK